MEGLPVTLKIELLQRRDSFKARGAVAKLLTLTDEQRAAGVVAVSGGNHGVAVAEMSAALGVRATVVMPRTAPARSGRSRGPRARTCGWRPRWPRPSR
jgi:threonine dehydratase